MYIYICLLYICILCICAYIHNMCVCIPTEEFIHNDSFFLTVMGVGFEI